MAKSRPGSHASLGATWSFRIHIMENQTRVTHFIHLILCPLFTSALRADGSSVRDVHHLKLSASSFTGLSSGLSPLCAPAAPLCSGIGQHCLVRGAGAARASGLNLLSH